MMKKVFCLASALMMVLMGCSGSVDEGWPKEIKGKDYSATRVDIAYDGSYSNDSMMDYISLTEEQLIKRSSLIAKIEVVDPVEYKINYQFGDKKSEKTMQAFQGKVLTVYYTDTDVKKGDQVKFLREEFWGRDNARITTDEVIKLQDGTYILFLENFDSHKEMDKLSSANFYTACEMIAPFFSSDLCRDIIECKEGNTYYFDQAFSSLASAATMSSIDKGMAWYQKQDDNFDEDIQAMVNQYKK